VAQQGEEHMSGWVLILIIYGGNGASITTQQFNNEKYCRQAGEAAIEMAKGTWREIKYTCTPKGV
jgi:hypothetical protein